VEGEKPQKIVEKDDNQGTIGPLKNSPPSIRQIAALRKERLVRWEGGRRGGHGRGGETTRQAQKKIKRGETGTESAKAIGNEKKKALREAKKTWGDRRNPQLTKPKRGKNEKLNTIRTGQGKKKNHTPKRIREPQKTKPTPKQLGKRENAGQKRPWGGKRGTNYPLTVEGKRRMRDSTTGRSKEVKKYQKRAHKRGKTSNWGFP